MKKLTEKEAHDLLERLIFLRKKYNRYRSRNNRLAYKNFEQHCELAFDYLVVTRTQKYRNFANYDDLQQEGRMALLLALRSFKLNFGSFFWWADHYIKTKISREANKHSTIKIPIKHAKHCHPYKVSELPIIVDTNLDALQVLEHDEFKQQINEAIDKLPEMQREVIKLNGIKSYSIIKIARQLKISQATCVKLLNEAKQNLKENLRFLSY